MNASIWAHFASCALFFLFSLEFLNVRFWIKCAKRRPNTIIHITAHKMRCENSKNAIGEEDRHNRKSARSFQATDTDRFGRWSHNETAAETKKKTAQQQWCALNFSVDDLRATRQAKVYNIFMIIFRSFALTFFVRCRLFGSSIFFGASERRTLNIRCHRHSTIVCVPSKMRWRARMVFIIWFSGQVTKTEPTTNGFLLRRFFFFSVSEKTVENYFSICGKMKNNFCSCWMIKQFFFTRRRFIASSFVNSMIHAHWILTFPQTFSSLSLFHCTSGKYTDNWSHLIVVIVFNACAWNARKSNFIV